MLRLHTFEVSAFRKCSTFQVQKKDTIFNRYFYRLTQYMTKDTRVLYLIYINEYEPMDVEYYPIQQMQMFNSFPVVVYLEQVTCLFPF